jgi:hypothetical protein
MKPLAFVILWLNLVCSINAADVELSVTRELSMSHSLNWVKQQAQPNAGAHWNGVLDEVKWGTPSPQQASSRDWDIPLTDLEWQALVDAHDAEPMEASTFDLWIPATVDVVKGVVAISSHGSGRQMFEDPVLRQIARDLQLGLFCFIGNPVQRGFWPRRLLFDQLDAFGQECGHPELKNAPLFLYGHSNGTGFSAIFTAGASERVWAWVSMRPGTTFQIYQPRAAQVPGLVVFGEDDPFLKRPSVAENLSVLPLARKTHDALWNAVVEPKTGHGPTSHTWPLVYSFLQHTFADRVPVNADPRLGIVKLNVIDSADGLLGNNWDPGKGGYQKLELAPVSDLSEDISGASWLINEDYAADWQMFQEVGHL